MMSKLLYQFISVMALLLLCDEWRELVPAGFKGRLDVILQVLRPELVVVVVPA
jgi:hypothetical protein